MARNQNILYEGRNISNITEINSNGSLSNNPDEITNTFNKYFANVDPIFAYKIKKADGNSTMFINQVVDSMFLSPTNETEIINIV